MPVSLDHVVQALIALGGQGHSKEIGENVLRIAPEPHPEKIGRSVRPYLHQNCAQSRSYRKGAPHLFESVYGIDEEAGVWRLANIDTDSLNGKFDLFIEAGEDLEDEEGKAILRVHLLRERSKSLVNAFKSSLQSYECSACTFNFEHKYGELGKEFIEAHHTIPVGSMLSGHKTKLKDFCPLCSNCHRMVHRNGLISVEELRDQINEKK